MYAVGARQRRLVGAEREAEEMRAQLEEKGIDVTVTAIAYFPGRDLTGKLRLFYPHSPRSPEGVSRWAGGRLYRVRGPWLHQTRAGLP